MHIDVALTSARLCLGGVPQVGLGQRRSKGGTRHRPWEGKRENFIGHVHSAGVPGSKFDARAPGETGGKKGVQTGENHSRVGYDGARKRRN